MLRHLRGRWGGEGATGLRCRQISRSSVGLGLFPTVDDKRDPFPRDRGEGRALLFGSAGSFSGRKRENWTVFVVELGENRERFVKKVAGEQSAGASYGVVNLSQCFDSHSHNVGL